MEEKNCSKKIADQTGPKRTEYQRELDRETINSLRLMGWNQWKIAEKINEGRPEKQHITRQVISKELIAIKKAAQERLKQTHDDWLEEQLAQIDHVQNEAWQAWLKSHNNKTTIQETDRKGFNHGSELTKTTEDAKPEPRYLDVVLKCVKMRNELFGIEPPKIHKVIGDQSLSDYLTNPEWLKYQQRLLKALDKYPDARAALAQEIGKDAPKE